MKSKVGLYLRVSAHRTGRRRKINSVELGAVASHGNVTFYDASGRLVSRSTTSSQYHHHLRCFRPSHRAASERAGHDLAYGDVTAGCIGGLSSDDPVGESLSRAVMAD